MRLIDLDEFLRQNCIDRMDGKSCEECKLHVLAVSCERLMEQPTIDPVKWIPCEKRLPEANGRYLVTRGLNACGALWNRVYVANYSDLMGIKTEKIWWQGNVGKSDFERLYDVTAWMPLPMPWRGEEDEV